MRGLLRDGGLVQEVADETQREDGGGEGVASILRVAAEELRQDLVVVFLAGDDTATFISAEGLHVGGSRLTYFQKRGLKAIEAAETVYGTDGNQHWLTSLAWRAPTEQALLVEINVACHVVRRATLPGSERLLLRRDGPWRSYLIDSSQLVKSSVVFSSADLEEVSFTFD